MASDDGANRHHQYERLVAAEDGEAAVAAVSCEAHQHGRQTDCEREAAGELDVTAEQENERRDEEFAAGDTEAARNSLVEFRRRYPKYVLPEDLRDLATP